MLKHHQKSRSVFHLNINPIALRRAKTMEQSYLGLHCCSDVSLQHQPCCTQKSQKSKEQSYLELHCCPDISFQHLPYCIQNSQNSMGQCYLRLLCLPKHFIQTFNWLHSEQPKLCGVVLSGYLGLHSLLKHFIQTSILLHSEQLWSFWLFWVQ